MTDPCVLLKQMVRKLLRLAVDASACSPCSCAPQRRILVPARGMQQSTNSPAHIAGEGKSS